MDGLAVLHEMLTRLVALNVPPVKVPPVVSVVPPLEAKFTVAVAEPPGAIVPSDCGSGVPLVLPSLAIVSEALLAGKVPMLLTVIIAWTVLGLVHVRVEVVISLTLPHGVGPAVNVKVTGPRLVCNVAVIVCPGVSAGSAVNVKSRPTVAPGAIVP